MNFRVVTEEGSTAQAGVHYEALKDNYIFPAHQPATVLPVVILKKGEELDHKTVLLKLRLETTTDLDVALPEKCYVRLLVTNQLLKPAYWDVSPLPIYFGAYSQVKHLKCIEIMGHDFPLTQGELVNYGGVQAYTYWMRAGRAVCNYYASHIEYDEKGNLITTWEPL